MRALRFLALTIVALIERASARSIILRLHYLDTAPLNFTKPVSTHDRLIGVNGDYAWNTIMRATVGETLSVTVVNGLEEPTSIHWHGLYQRGANHFDGATGVTQCGVPPGRAFTYKIALDRAGTFWWHSHVQTQYARGLKGALVVQELDQGPPEVLLQLSDWYSIPVSELWREPMPTAILANGQPRSVLHLTPNETHRVRLINMGILAPLNFSIDGHELTVIEVDGILVRPVSATRLKIAVGQRYSVLVTPKQGGHWVRAEAVYASDESPRAVMGPAEPVALVSAGYGEDSVPQDPPMDLVESDLHAFSGIPPMPTVFLEMRLKHAVVRGQERSSVSVNWSPFSPYTSPREPTLLAAARGVPLPEASKIIRVSNGTAVQLTIWNNDTGEHPFHLHGHSFWVVERGRGPLTAGPRNPTESPVLRDTVSISACAETVRGTCTPDSIEYVVLRFVADNPGAWLFHCHVDQHLLSGLALTFLVAHESLKVPSEVSRLCMLEPGKLQVVSVSPLELAILVSLVPAAAMAVAGTLFHVRGLTLSALATNVVERFAAGIVIAAVATELAPMLVEGSALAVLGGFAAGCATAFSIKIVGDWLSRDSFGVLPTGKVRYSHLETSAVRRMPWGMIFATAVDAIGDGLLLGLTSLGGGLRACTIVAAALSVEMGLLGISVAERMRRGGVSARKSIGVALVLPMLIVAGAALGALVPADDLAAPMAFGTAVLLYLVVEELLEPAESSSSSLLARVQFFVGYASVLLLDHLE